jgi:flagellar hook-associated protein 2
MRTATAGANAQIQVGGSGGYTLNSQTDTFSGLLPGLSITVASPTAAPVTVTVAPDATAMSTAVQSMVTAGNQVLTDIQEAAGYNAATKVAGPLMGSAVLQNLQNQVLGIFAATAGSSTLGNGASVGLSLNDGQIGFDQTKFATAFTANPTDVANLFTEGGGFTPSSPTYNGAVSFSYASPSSQSGSYDVNITNSATQATDAGSTLSGGTVGSAETLTIAANGLSVNYATTAGESLADVASGINAALAGAGISLSAQVLGGQQLQLTSSDFGSAAGFSVTSTDTGAGTTGLAGGTAGTAASFSGTDVAGTINGVAATGSGQFLSAPVSDPTLAGLSLQISVSGITSATDLGTFNYQPGIAQSLNSLTTAMSNPTNGSITLAAQGLTTQANSMNTEISFDQTLAAAEQKSLQAEYSQLEVTLGSIKDQSSALTSALASLSS